LPTFILLIMATTSSQIQALLPSIENPIQIEQQRIHKIKFYEALEAELNNKKKPKRLKFILSFFFFLYYFISQSYDLNHAKRR
jgi:hypothetical protein